MNKKVAELQQELDENAKELKEYKEKYRSEFNKKKEIIDEFETKSMIMKNNEKMKFNLEREIENQKTINEELKSKIKIGRASCRERVSSPV